MTGDRAAATRCWRAARAVATLVEREPGRAGLDEDQTRYFAVAVVPMLDCALADLERHEIDGERVRALNAHVPAAIDAVVGGPALALSLAAVRDWFARGLAALDASV